MTYIYVTNRSLDPGKDADFLLWGRECRVPRREDICPKMPGSEQESTDRISLSDFHSSQIPDYILFLIFHIYATAFPAIWFFI